MEIAVIGAGRIGSTIGLKWAQVGHKVAFGVRDPLAAKFAEMRQTPGMVSVGSIAEALAQAEVILLGLAGTAVEEVVRQHKDAINGRIVIDATNQFGRPTMHNMAFFTAVVPKATVFRAFNSLGVEVFKEPQFGALAADHFYCGPGGMSRDVVERLISEIGVRPVYLGGPEAASLLDGLTRVWFALVSEGYGRHTALRLLTD